MLFWGTRLAGEELQPYTLGIYPLSEAASLQGTHVQPNVVMSESKLFGFASKTHAFDFHESIPKMEYVVASLAVRFIRAHFTLQQPERRWHDLPLRSVKAV